MALKDWKKAKQIIGFQHDYGFERKDNQMNFIKIRKLSIGFIGFWVEIYRDGIRIIDKKYHNKSQALRFAKSYMRTH